jgi:hypothetical protein
MKISYDNKNFELKFGFGVFLILGKMWNLVGVNSVFKKVMSSMTWAANIDFDNLKEEDLANIEIPFDSFTVLADLVIGSIVANKENKLSIEDLDQTDVANWVFNNQELMGPIMSSFIASFPKPKTDVEPGKLKAVKK